MLEIKLFDAFDLTSRGEYFEAAHLFELLSEEYRKFDIFDKFYECLDLSIDNYNKIVNMKIEESKNREAIEPILKPVEEKSERLTYNGDIPVT